MRVICSNCGTFSNIQIPKGTEKEDVAQNIECPHCGVKGRCQFT